MPDPFVAAVAAVLQETLERGVVVTPTGLGWHVRLATPLEDAPAPTGTDSQAAAPWRAW
jgi:hypothetical protein